MGFAAAKGRYVLEPLEPRVLLSADLLVAAGGSASPDGSDPVGACETAAVASEDQGGSESVSAASLGYDPLEQVEDVFAGVGAEAVESGETGKGGGSTDQAPTVRAGVEAGGSDPAVADVALSEEATVSTVTDGSSSAVEELTASLYTANGPPGMELISSSHENLAAALAGQAATNGIIGWGYEYLPREPLTGVIKVAVGEHHSLALKADGTVVAWGDGFRGETWVPWTAYNVIDIAVGGYHSLALRSDGKVISWGGTPDTGVPPSDLKDVTAIAAGTYHSLALKSDGKVVGWGPGAAAKPPDDLRDVIAIAAGAWFSLAVKSDGKVVKWGESDWIDIPEPPSDLTDVIAVAVSYDPSSAGGHCLALKRDGTVVGWGNDWAGQASPPDGLRDVQAVAAAKDYCLALKRDGTVQAWGWGWGYGANPPEGLSDVTAIAAGAYYSLAVKRDGTVVGWGIGGGGALVPTVPKPDLTDVVSVAAGDGFSLALRSDGTVVGWGDNSLGKATPPEGLTDVIAIAAGTNHSLALKRDGTVVGWGDPWWNWTRPPDGLSGVIAISVGCYYSLALKNDGTVVGWGEDWSGAATPPQGLRDVVAISAGYSHSLALKKDGSVVFWGQDYWGQAARLAALTDVVAIAAGDESSLVLKRDGTVLGWGPGFSWDGSVIATGAIAIAASRNPFNSGHGAHSLVLKNDGTVVGWGEDNLGQATPPENLTGVVAIAAGAFHSLALTENNTNLALNLERSGTPHPLASDGLGDPWTIVDGELIYFDGSSGLAFTGGSDHLGGETAGPRQATITLRSASVVRKLIIWHRGADQIPQTPTLEYWDGTAWCPITFQRIIDTQNLFGLDSIPDVCTFSPVKGTKFRYSFDNREANILGTQIKHGWIYEFEVYGHVRNAAPTLDPISDIGWLEQKTASDGGIPLTGITAGLLDSDQSVTVTATSSNEAIVQVVPGGLWVDSDGKAWLFLRQAAHCYGESIITVTVRDDGGTENGGVDTISRQFTVRVFPVNDAPTLAAIAPLEISEGAPEQTVNLTDITPGPLESQQHLTVTATSSDPDIIPHPTVEYTDPNNWGRLKFTPVPYASGTVTITVTVKDDGGTLRGGVDTFSQTFTVKVTPVNNAPTFELSRTLEIAEDADWQAVDLTGISAGLGEAGQPVTITATSKNPALIPNDTAHLRVEYTSPSTTGKLWLKPAADLSGQVDIDVIAQDLGLDGKPGADDSSTTKTITVTIRPVNDPPTLAPIVDPSVRSIPEDSPLKIVHFSGITAGGGESQHLTVTATSSDPNVIPDPIVDYTSPNSSGALSLAPKKDANGAVTITVTVEDDAPAAEGGKKSVSQSFQVDVWAVNDAPTINAFSPVSVVQDSGPRTIALSGISPGGGADEASQQVWVSAVSGNLGLIAAPTVSFDLATGKGTLRFQPIAGAYGKTRITVTVRDNGGTAAGGMDTLETGFDVEVTPATLAVNWASPADIVYGTALGAAQLNATANQPGKFTYNPTAGTFLTAGSNKTLTVTFRADDQVAYPNPITKTVTINVTKAPLTVKANDQQIAWGTSLPAFTWTAAGFVAGDTAATTPDLQVTATTTATPTSGPGTYDINVSGPAETANYRVTYTAGKLVIKQELPQAISFPLGTCVRLDVATIAPVASPQPNGPVATGSGVELTFLGLPATPKFSFDRIDLFRDDGSSELNGFELTIPARLLPGPVGLGGDISRLFLEYTHPTIQASQLKLRHGVKTGELVLTAAAATLFPQAANFRGAISDGGQGGAGLTARYQAAQDRWVLEAKELIVTVDGVLRTVTSAVTFNYPACGTADGVLATVPSLTVTLTAFNNFAIAGSALTLRPNGFSLGRAQVPSADLALSSILELTQASVALEDVSYILGQPATGRLVVSTGAARLFPRQTTPTVTLSDGPDAGSAVLTGSFDFGTEVFALTLDTVTVDAQGLLFLSLQGAALRYDLGGDDSQVLLSVDAVSVDLPSFGTHGTAVDLQINQRGEFNVVSVALDHPAPQILGVGGLLPFTISAVTVQFAGDTNQNGRRDAGEVFRLDAFDLSVSGSFDFSRMAALPFRPIIRIGASGEQSVFDDAQDQFAFTVTVADGKVRPKNLGPIEIGVADLQVGETVQMSGAIKLGGYQNGRWVNSAGGTLRLVANSAMRDIDGGDAITITVQFDGDRGTLEVTAGFPVSFSFTAGDIIRVTDAYLTLELGLGVGGDSAITLRKLQLVSTRLERVELALGDFLELTATDATLNFRPEAGQDIATFGTLSARLGFLGFTGIARNFAIGPSGAFKALPGFAVGFDLESGQSSALKWPDWLPLKLPHLELIWPKREPQSDWYTYRRDYQAMMTVELSGLKGLPLKVTGRVEDAVIDLHLLKQGKFPVVSIGSALLEVSGELCGGEIGGTLAVGLLRLDAAGNPIRGGDTTTPVADRILYGGIIAEFAFSGLSGFEIRIGLSERGPLSLYVMADVPVLLEPISGLTIRKFRAGVTFDTVLPSVTDPLALRGNAFRPQSQMTAAQWWDQVQLAVVNQSRAPPGSGFWSALSRPMKIEGGALLYSAYASEHTFRADCDLVISTDGKFLINALCTYGDTLQQRSIFYADLHQLKDGKAILLYLSDSPADSPVLTYRGALSFEFGRWDNTPVTSTNQADFFQFRIAGGIDVQAYDLATITLDGELTLRFGSSRFDVNLWGELKLTALGKRVTLAGAAGALHVDASGSTVQVWGALALGTNLDFLKSVGVEGNTTTVFTLNLTGQTREEELIIPGRDPVSVLVKAKSVGFRTEGTLQFKREGVDWFRLTGTYAFELSGNGQLMALVAGQLELQTAEGTLLGFGCQGFLQLSSRGVAARLDLSLAAGFPDRYGVRFVNTRFTLVLNTTSETVSYMVPSNEGASRSVTVPGRPPGRANQPYLLIAAEGSIEVLSLRIDGSFNLLVAPAAIQMEVAGSLALVANNTTFLAFDVLGSFQVDRRGVAAVVGLHLQRDLPDDLGVSLSASFRLEVNTTSDLVALPSATLPAGPYARIRADGTLLVMGLRLDGRLGITVSGSGLDLTADATLSLSAEGVRLFGFKVDGQLHVDDRGLAGTAEVSLRSALSLGYYFDATYRLEINTTGRSVALEGTTLEAGRYARVLAEGRLRVGSFLVAGSFGLSAGVGEVQVTARARLDLKAGSTTVVGFTVEGGLAIRPTGMVAAFDLRRAADVAEIPGISLSTTFRLEINTTSHTVLVNEVTVPAYTVRVAAQGSLQVLGAFRFDGRFWLQAQPDRILLLAEASFDFFGRQVSFGANVGLLGDGLAFEVPLSLSELSGGFFTLRGSFLLQVNTTGRSVFDIPARSALVSVTGGRLSLAGLSLSGTVNIGYVEGRLQIDAPASAPLTVSVFNAFTAQVYGFIRSDGRYSLTGTGSVRLGRNDLVALSGDASVAIADTGASATINGQVYLLGQAGPRVGTTFTLRTDGFSAKVTVAVSCGIQGILRVNGSGTLTISERGLVLSGRVGTRILDTFSVSMDFEINTLTARYSFQGSAGFSRGGSSLGATATVRVRATNYEGVQITATGNAWAGFDIWGIGARGNVGFEASVGLDGRFDVEVGACVSVKKWGVKLKVMCGSVTVHVSLRSGIRIWLSDIANAHVFLDVNGNGVADPNEPQTVTDADGNFTFNDQTGDDVGTIPAYEPLGSLAAFDRNANQRLDPDEGRLYVVGGTRTDLVTGEPIPGDGPIESDPVAGPPLAGLCPADGATLVFFDANQNGRQDAGEVGVVPGADGFYSFIDLASIRLNNLGRLKPFDTDHNGVIDAAEGHFVLYGGTDKNTGLPSSQVIRLPAYTYGAGLYATANPLSDLLFALEQAGMTHTTANRAIQAAFGLPTQIDVTQFDPRSLDANDPLALRMTLRAATQLSTVLQTGAAAFRDPASGRAALLDQFVSAVRPLTLPDPWPTDANGDPLSVVQLDLTDVQAVQRLLTGAAAITGEPWSTAQWQAIARVITETNRQIGVIIDSAGALQAAECCLLLAPGSSEDLITAAAGTKKVSQVEAAAAVTQIVNNPANPGSVADTFVAGFADYLRDTKLPPYIGRLDDLASDGASLSLAVVVQDPNELTGTLQVTASADNPSLLPAGTVSLTPSANGWDLTLAPVRGVSGETTVTVQATITFADGSSLSSTEAFQLKVAAVNQAPTLSALADQVIPENGHTGPLAFTIGDVETPSGALTVTAVASDPMLVPASGLILAGQDQARTLTVTPASNQSGVAAITILVSDGSVQTATTFVLTVLPRNDAPTLALVPDARYVDAGHAGGLGLSVPENSQLEVMILRLGDRESDPDTLTIQFASDNPALLPPEGLALSGAGAERHLTLLPVNGQSGSAQVTVTASDGVSTVTERFDVEVTPVNTPPVLGPIAPRTTPEGTPLTVDLIVRDDHTPLPNLRWKVELSDPELLAAASVAWNNAAARCQLTLRPATGRFGSTLITVSASDSEWTTAEAFVLTVVPDNTAPTISRIPDQIIATGHTTGILEFTVADRERDPALLILAASSSNPALVDAHNVQFGGWGAERTLIVAPTAGATGTTTITVSVSDGRSTASTAFDLEVRPLELGMVAWASLATHAAAGPVALVIPDDGTFSESRASGVRQLQITFSAPIEPSSFNPDSIRLAGLSAANGQPVDLRGLQWTTSLQPNHQLAIVTFSQPLPDNARYRVAVQGVVTPEGVSLSGDVDRVFTALVGDVNGDLRVDNADLGGLQSLRGLNAIDPSALRQARCDLNLDGRVNNLDLGGLYPLRGRDARFIPDPATFATNALLPGDSSALPGLAATPSTQQSPSDPGPTAIPAALVSQAATASTVQPTAPSNGVAGVGAAADPAPADDAAGRLRWQRTSASLTNDTWPENRWAFQVQVPPTLWTAAPWGLRAGDSSLPRAVLELRPGVETSTPYRRVEPLPGAMAHAAYTLPAGSELSRIYAHDQ